MDLCFKQKAYSIYKYKEYFQNYRQLNDLQIEDKKKCKSLQKNNT